MPNAKEIHKIPRSDILIYRNAYAIMPVGKKDMMMFHVNKERTPVCTTNTCEGSSLFILVVEHPLVKRKLNKWTHIHFYGILFP